MIFLLVLFKVIQFSSSTKDDLFVLGDLKVSTKDKPKLTSDQMASKNTWKLKNL